MPGVLGLRSVAACIAAGYDGPQHIDEPWDYDFEIGQMAWVRLQYSGGRGCPAKWVLGKVISKAFAKVSDPQNKTPCKHYKVGFMQKNGLGVCIDSTPEFGGMKPDCYYIRELLKEELLCPIDSESDDSGSD